MVFIYFAYLNTNDPDAWLWVSIYLFTAICCIAALVSFFPPWVYLAAAIFCGAYAVVLSFVEDGAWDWIAKYKMPNIAAEMQAEHPWIEQTREFFGLLICISILLLNYFLWVL